MKKIELSRDSWYGQLLGHPAHIGSLVWGVLWRSSAALMVTLFTIGYMKLWSVMFQNAFLVDHHSSGAAFFLLLLLSFIPIIVLVCTYEHWSRYTKKAVDAIALLFPRIEWK